MMSYVSLGPFPLRLISAAIPGGKPMGSTVSGTSLNVSISRSNFSVN
jgi:hypothetical protein